MSLYYRNQNKVETLSRKTTSTSYRLSDQRYALYGGRGSKYDELVYLRGQNGDAATVNQKPSDAWSKFAVANSSSGSRADEVEREFYKRGTYP